MTNYWRKWYTGITFLLVIIVGFTGFWYRDQQTGETGIFEVGTQGSTISGELNFGVYWDRFRTQPVESIDWGVLEPGDSKNTEVYIANFEDKPIYIIGAFSNNSDPIEFEQHHNVSVVLSQIEPLRVIPVNLTLTISENITDINNFKFDLVLSLNDTG